jgi:antitoxin (DNA-binding transcriptional repressor) of toxin-antitoxin stability system
MYQIDIDKAKVQLTKLFQAALDGEVIIITQNDQPILKLAPVLQFEKRRQSGSAKGLISISDDFDQPLGDFREYIQ